MMVSDRAYVPEPVPSWTQIIADKDAEIARLNNIIQDMRYAENEDRIRVLLENIRLRDTLKECADELDAYYLMEYPGDHPYSQAKLAQALAHNPAREALAEEKQGG